MTHKQKTWLKAIGGALLAYFALTVIASEGTIIDQTTGKPIAGAFVIAYWNGNVNSVVQTHTSCYHLEATRTDENGRFKVSMFSGNLNPIRQDRTRNEHIYVPGYEVTYKSDVEKLSFMMTPRVGSRSEQFKAIMGLGSQGAGCSSGDQKSRVPYLRALHKELAALASTANERVVADEALSSADILEFGEEIANQNYQKRREAKWKEAK